MEADFPSFTNDTARSAGGEANMPYKLQFSLRSLLVVQLVALLVLGWLGDHWYQTSRFNAVAPSAQLCLAKERLSKAIADARQARSEEEYTDASDHAISVMVWSCERGRDANCMIATYVEAMRVPDWPDYRNESFSMPATASVALAAIGPDALPVILGLLHDDDPEVRMYAAISLQYLTKGGNIYVTPLPKQDMVKYLPAVKEAVARERLRDVLSPLETVLEELSGP